MNKIIVKVVALICVTVLAGLIARFCKEYLLFGFILEIIVLYYCLHDINKWTGKRSLG